LDCGHRLCESDNADQGYFIWTFISSFWCACYLFLFLTPSRQAEY